VGVSHGKFWGESYGMPAIQTFPSKFRRSSLSGGRTPVSNQTPLILVSAAVVSAAGLAPSSALTSVPSSASTAASNEPPRVMARLPSSMPVMFDGTSSGEKDEKSCVVVAHVVNSWARFDVAIAPASSATDGASGGIRLTVAVSSYSSSFVAPVSSES